MKVLSLTWTCCDCTVIDQEMKVDLWDTSLMSFPLVLSALAIEFFRIRTRDDVGVATGAVLLACVRHRQSCCHFRPISCHTITLIKHDAMPWTDCSRHTSKNGNVTTYTGYTQNNGAVSMVNKGNPHHSFVYTLYTVEPGYNDIGLYDISSMASDILCYPLIRNC
jgi:hypothetical protein